MFSSVTMPAIEIFLLFLSVFPISSQLTSDCNQCTFEVYSVLTDCDEENGNIGEPDVRLECLYRRLSGQPCVSCICPVLWMFDLTTEFEYCIAGIDFLRSNKLLGYY